MKSNESAIALTLPRRGLALTEAPIRDDAVTAMRREMKFIIPGAGVDKVRDVLAVNLKPVAFGASPVSRVSSIYFDDERLTSCMENLDGIARRVKVRVRWYDEDLPTKTVFFELKRRHGNTVRKDRVALSLSAPLACMTYRQIIDQLADVLPRDMAAWLTVRGEPSMLVMYRRQHFRDPDSGVRVTLDERIAGCDQWSARRPTTRFAVPLHDLVIVEAKAGSVDEQRVRQLLYPLKPRLTRSSKYVQCCQAAGSGRLID